MAFANRGGDEPRHLGVPHPRREAQRDDTDRPCKMLSKDSCAEARVVCQQDSVRLPSPLEHLNVINARRGFCHAEHIVPLLSETSDDRPAHVLIGEEVHRSGGFKRDHMLGPNALRSVGETGPQSILG